MRLFLSIFLLLSMLSSVAVSVVQQIQNSDVCEFKESKNDEKSDAEEKEAKSEKDLISFKITSSIMMGYDASFYSKKSIHTYNKDLVSSLYSSLPYNPPEV